MTLPDTTKSTSPAEEQNLREMAGDKQFEVAQDQSSTAQVSRSGKGPTDPVTPLHRAAEEPNAQVSRSQKAPDDEPEPPEQSSSRG